MQASPLAAALGLPLDGAGRLPVDPWLAVTGAEAAYAAGDIAAAEAAPGHPPSCPASTPGRWAASPATTPPATCWGGRPNGPLAAPDYVTILDLGPWGAAYAKRLGPRYPGARRGGGQAVKQPINGTRIYPPPGGDRAAILAAAAPVIQAAPAAAAGAAKAAAPFRLPRAAHLTRNPGPHPGGTSRPHLRHPRHIPACLRFPHPLAAARVAATP